jgi:hypothetical protein
MDYCESDDYLLSNMARKMKVKLISIGEILRLLTPCCGLLLCLIHVIRYLS